MRARRRSLGNIRFIGELYKLKMLTARIMHECIKKLLKSTDEESLECLSRYWFFISSESHLIDNSKCKFGIKSLWALTCSVNRLQKGIVMTLSVHSQALLSVHTGPLNQYKVARAYNVWITRYVRITFELKVNQTKLVLHYIQVYYYSVNESF
jgi:hypothetical protein